MNPSLQPSPAARFERLAKYLQEDPHNAPLLADACEAAIAAGRHDEALELIVRAEGLGLEAAEWTFRRARLSIARRDLQQATALLAGLRANLGEHPAIAHDLAYVRFLQGDLAGCRALLEPLLGPTDGHAAASGNELDALQVLWLRATHHLGLVEEAWGWAESRMAAGALQPAAKGVASLIAVDADSFEAARTLADQALASKPDQVEALVARASVALAEGQNPAAQLLLQRALQVNGEDGRTWSSLGLASLQARNIPLAQTQLERAVRTLPGHVGTWHALGWARLLQGEKAGAQQAFERALELDRNFAESHGAMGLVLALAGNQRQAEHHLDVADKLDAHNVTGRYARAVLAGEAGEAAKLSALAMRLLDRPGLFGGKLSDSMMKGAGRE